MKPYKEFCHPNGEIDWGDLVAFNSGKEPLAKN